MQLLGRYQPLFVIGRGGMGTIELAIDGSGAVVALKRMLSSVRDKRHTEMFLREARLATLLNHDNVVHAFAFGEQDGEIVIAMEYVEGETLSSLLQHHKLPLEIATYVLAELCEGLHAAHELKDVTGAPLGVVHRDVSPHNVMLSYAGGVKLLDFGVAKLESVQLTKTGDVKGKTAYMSPEQAMGEPLDRRSDLYGLGAVLFELVAGRRMWSGETDLEHIRQLALSEPPSLASVAPDAPKALHELHAKLVAKKPADRPETAAAVAKALRATLPPGADPRRALERMLHDIYADAMREKKHKLEAAMSSRATDDHALAVSPPSTRPSRAAPWMYAIGGALVASVAVFALAKARAPQVAESASTATATISASSAPQADPKAQPSATTTVETRATATPPVRNTTRVRSSPAQTTPPRATPSATTAPPPPRPPIDVDTHPI